MEKEKIEMEEKYRYRKRKTDISRIRKRKIISRKTVGKIIAVKQKRKRIIGIKNERNLNAEKTQISILTFRP